MYGDVLRMKPPVPAQSRSYSPHLQRLPYAALSLNHPKIRGFLRPRENPAQTDFPLSFSRLYHRINQRSVCGGKRRSKIRFPSFITGQTRGAFAEGRGGAKYASRLLSQDKPAERLSCEEEEQRNERTLPPSGKASDIELAPTRFTNCS